MIHLDEKLESQGLEKAVLIGIYNREVPKEKAEEYLDELTLLVETAGAVTLGSYLQRMERINPGTYIGKGKLEEIKEFIDAHKVDLVVFDDDLSPSQVRNIDKILDVKVLDRSGIILEIFGERARTAQAKAQVELAHLQYMLPRLTGLWTHLEKQRGGIGLKGAGEKEIETDRRMIRHKIDLLKKELEKIDKQNRTRRKGRDELVRVALVGYTNAGKSTIMNLLSKSEVLAEDKLFATLDTTVRKVVLEQVPFLLSDTVGFIRKLPHNLIECFKSTLDEVRESDVLVHVVDATNPSYEDHLRVVSETLNELGAGQKPCLTVFNKADRLGEAGAERMLDSYVFRSSQPAVLVSALERDNTEKLRAALLGVVRQHYKDKYPHSHFAKEPEWMKLMKEENES